MFNFMIVVNDDDGELKSVKSEDIPNKLRRHLDGAISLALDLDASADELRPTMTIGSISDEDRNRLRLLDALEQFGVDTWEGYSLAQESLDSEDSDSEFATPTE